MPSKKQRAGEKWSLQPHLHDEVAGLLEDDNLFFDFHNADRSGAVKEYDTNIMGRFACRSPSCSSTGWSSKKIAITIRMYSGAKYNARVCHQRCKECDQLAKPMLDDSYAERVAYRLKKWCRVAVEKPTFRGKTSNRPHERSLCEGCKAGHCSELRVDEDDFP